MARRLFKCDGFEERGVGEDHQDVWLGHSMRLRGDFSQLQFLKLKVND